MPLHRIPAIPSFLRWPLARGAFVGLMTALMAGLISLHPFLQSLEDWAVDTCFILRGGERSACPITIIGIDSETLDHQKKPTALLSPELAEVLNYLTNNRVAAVGLDVMIPSELEDQSYLQEGEPGDAEPMGRLIATSGNIVLPIWEVGQETKQPIQHWSAGREMHYVLNTLTANAQGRPVEPRDDRDFGFVNLVTASDKFIRRHRPQARFDGGPRDEQGSYYSLPVCLAAFALNTNAEDLVDQMPRDNHDVRINFLGPPGSIRHVSFLDVLDQARGTSPADTPWEGEIVIIGATDPTLADYHNTPFSNTSVLSELSVFSDRASSERRMSGPEIHANVVRMIHDRAYLQTVSFPVATACLLVTGMALGALLVQFGIEVCFLIALGHYFAWRVIAYLSFVYASTILPIMPILVCGALTFTVTFALRWRFMRRTMGMFKSEAVARELESHPHQLNRQGERRDVTILFSDVRNFTTFSEEHPPDEVVRLLNAYFTQVVPVIEKEGGILNQYIGDGVMAIFGSPVRLPDHAFRALTAAVEMLKRVHQHAETWNDLGAPQFKIGIGICSGDVVVGTIGSPRRLDYTAIGDTVNTAARIESATKDLQAEILVSMSTYQQLTPQQRASLDATFSEPISHHVKGRIDAVQVFKVTPR